MKITIKISMLVVAFLAVLSTMPASQGFATDTDTSYMPVLSDIPLPPGLSLEDESNVVFEGPEGKIVETVAFGPVDLKEVKDFYRNSLAALGWQKVSGAPWSFKRDEEALEIKFQEKDETVEVHFRFTSSAPCAQ